MSSMLGEELRSSSVAADRQLLRAMFDAAIEAARPWNRISDFLPDPPPGRTIVIGAGKAASQMAGAVERVWKGPLQGVVVTGKGQGVQCERIEVLEASHPVPDESGLAATSRMLERVKGLGRGDLVLALISGGGSAMMPAPAEGLTLADEQAINRSLLASGAPIRVMNLIRNQFSLVKGGRLALACHPARVVTLVLSDIPGDDPSLVASGPTIPMDGTRARARELVDLYGVSLPARASGMLLSDFNLPPSAEDQRLRGNEMHVVASAATSLAAARMHAELAGLSSHILSSSMEGEARVVGTVHASLAREMRECGRPFHAPSVFLSGGETTVTLKGAGRGGRNTEFLLSFAIGIDGLEGITAMAADTDGIDGSEKNAGAFADGTTVARMRRKGVDPIKALVGNDAYGAFEAIGDLLFTGPTGTNVNDLRAIVVR
jgi:hydroxypyruvate reductase